MPSLKLSRWLSRIGSATFEGAVHRARLDARAREAFNLSRWFAGIGIETEAARRQQDSPEASARIRTAVETLPVTLFEFDSHGIYTSVAGGYVAMFGITAAQIVGRSVFDFPRFVPGKNLMVRRALGGEAVSFTGIWPLGRFMIRLQPRLDSDGRVDAVVGLGFELSKPMAADTEIEQLLAALQQSEARFRAMCESAPLGIFVGNSRLELGYVNPALCALVGRKPEELLGRHWQSALHADESERQFIVADSGVRGPYAHDGVLRIVRNDGALVWTSLRIAEMRDGVELLGYVGAITDITKERDARLAIDRAQQDLRRVIESSPEGIAVVRDGRWIFANRAMAQALGYARPAEVIGKHSAEIAHPDDETRAIELTAPHDPSWRDDVQELRYRRANGGYALMEVRPAVLTEFDGAPAVLITARDVTERRKLQAQLLVTERLISVGTLAAGVAHEINNPLAAVLGNLDWVATRLLRLGEPSSEVLGSGLVTELQRVAEAIDQSREAAGRVREIVRDLKMFSRAEEELKGPVDLAQVLDSAARMAWNEVRHRARLVREYGDLPAVQGSDARLGQVFLNLFINAAQAIPEGNVDEHEIRVSARASADRVVVEVRDTGSGISADVIGRIFDPFFTTKPPGFGTGLGLAICHKIVTSVGGQIDVESSPGRGTAFSVTLVVAAPDRPSVIASIPASAPSQLRGRVLVIDDDPSMGKAVALVLGEEHDVDVFTSAHSALAELQAGASYDAIICDVMMPEMSGVDFHAELSSTHPELSKEIIFLTGGAFTVRARDFLDRVPNQRLDKPFDSERFRALVNRQVSRATSAARAR